MTDKEIIDWYLANIKKGEEEFKARQDAPETKKIVEAIRTATKGEFIAGVYSSTLMGWTEMFDDEGRPLNCDPNYKDSEINISGNTYRLTRKGWWAYIWMPNIKAGYTTCWSEDRDKYLFALVDLRPDYIKEYDEARKKEQAEKNGEKEVTYEVKRSDDKVYILRKNGGSTCIIELKDFDEDNIK